MGVARAFVEELVTFFFLNYGMPLISNENGTECTFLRCCCRFILCAMHYEAGPMDCGKRFLFSGVSTRRTCKAVSCSPFLLFSSSCFLPLSFGCSRFYFFLRKDLQQGVAVSKALDYC